MLRFHSMPSVYRRTLTLCLLAILVAALAACGRGRATEEPAEQPAAATPVPEEPTATPEPPAEEPTTAPETEAVTETEEAEETEAITETEEAGETEAITETEAMTETEEAEETEAITETEEAGETEAITETEAMTETEEAAEPEEVTETEAMTETEEAEETEAITETEEAGETEAITETEAMTETEEAEETEAITETEEAGETGAITETEAMTETGAAPELPGEVIASDLNGPMGILLDSEGNVWVVDSGVGGETEVPFVDPESGEETTAMLGDTSRIVMIEADGTLTEIAVLPSVLMNEEASGGSRLALLDDTLYATSGAWLESIGPERMPLQAAIVSVDPDGTVTEVANTWDVEAADNPDTFVLESHPYGLTAGDGILWVADAGANTLLQVDPASGTVTVVATFEGIPGPLPNPFRGDAMEMDPVPTGVVVNEDGSAYVSLLSGFPFTPGSAKVVLVSPEGEVSDYATGLTMLTDLRRGPDDELYAVSIGEFSEQGPVPNSGAVVHVHEGEGSEAVIEGLPFPTSVDFDAEGNAYVTVNGVGAPGSGSVIKVEGIAQGE
jgi:sugar lactone lactonase YvrE